MITILSSFKTLLLFLVVITTGTTAPGLFHQDIGAQIFGQDGSDGINPNKDSQVSTNNPVLFDPFGQIDFTLPLSTMKSLADQADANSMPPASESAPQQGEGLAAPQQGEGLAAPQQGEV